MTVRRFSAAAFVFFIAAFMAAFMAGRPAYAGESSGMGQPSRLAHSFSSERGGFQLGPAIPAGQNQSAQISPRALWLFHVLLRADKGFTPSESQTFESWLKKDGRFAALQLAELMRELKIPLFERKIPFSDRRILRYDKQALRRILKDFYTEKSPAERQALYQKGMGHAQSYLAEAWLPNQAQKEGHLAVQPRGGFIAAFHEFVNNIKERYVVLDLTKRQRRAIETFRELLAARNSGSQTGDITAGETRLFRKVLKALNIPSHAQNDLLVNHYLEKFFAEAAAEGEKPSGAARAAEAASVKNHYDTLGLKPGAPPKDIKAAFQKMAQRHHPDRHAGKSEEEKSRHGEKMKDVNKAKDFFDKLSETGKASYDAKLAGSQGAEAIKAKGARASDHAVWEVLREMRGRFDQMHYDQLKEMGRFSNFVRGFGPQFALFSLAMGGAIYTKKYSDPVLYGVHRDPGELNETIDHLKDWGNLGMHAGSFAVFIAAANKTNTFFYGHGMRHDSRALRSLAPVAGLATGYIASTIAITAAQELFIEKDAQKCLSGRFFGGEGFENEYLNPCDRLYLKWVQGQGAKHAVDLGLVIGSMLLAHKAAQTLLGGIRIVPGGAAMLARITKAAGLRMTGYFGFFATIYLFMKTHFIADSVIGEKLKEHFSFQEAKAKMINFLRFSRPGASIDKESFVSEAKALGYKFSLWAGAKAGHYEIPLRRWTLQTNKIVSDYEMSSHLLKLLFQSASAPYGVNLPEAAEDPVFQEKNSPFDLAGSWMGFLASSDLLKRRFLCPYLAERDELKRQAASLAAFCFGKEGEESPGWTGDEVISHLLLALYWYLNEAANYQSAASQEGAGSGGPAAPDLSPMPASQAAFYLGAEPDELFSSGSPAASELSAEEKWRLAASLLEGLFTGELSPYYSEAALEKAEKRFCASIYPQEGGAGGSPELYGHCLAQREMAGHARAHLLNKMAAAAVYLMDDIRQSGFELDVYRAHPEFQPASFLKLASLMKARRKGEGLFAALREKSESLKSLAGASDHPAEEKNFLQFAADQAAAPALFLNLICGAPESPESGGEAESHLFAAPALFDGLPPEVCAAAPVFSVKNGGYAPLPDELAAFRSFLFGRRVQLFGRSHESLWLALEAYVRRYFHREDLMLSEFELRSAEALDSAAALALENLDLVTERHFIPELINRAAFEGGGSQARIADFLPAALSDAPALAPALEGESRCAGILNYYDAERAARERGFLEGFKGLEIYIFQSLFWMRQLKALKMKEAEASQPALQRAAPGSCLAEGASSAPDMDVYCPGPFNEAAYDKALCRAAELLQSYHDSYAAGVSREPRVFSPKKGDLKEIEKKMHPERNPDLSRDERFDIGYFLEDNPLALLVDPAWDPVEELQALYPGAPLPAWTPQKFIAFSILQKSYPEMNAAAYFDDTENNRDFSQEGKEAAYTALFEMRKSLGMFFRAMTALRAREEARESLRQ